MNCNRRKLYIENMLSQQCKKIVQRILGDLQLDCTMCELGAADVRENITPVERQELKIILSKHGFRLLDEEKTHLLERIISLIDEKFAKKNAGHRINYSDYLAENLGYEYHYLANLFSRIKGITLENYIIAFKIDKVKELLLYDDYSLTEISYKLEYSSVAHLSAQFKKVTGITPSQFKCASMKRHISTVRFLTPAASQYRIGSTG